MAVQTHPVITSQKRQLKCGQCAKIAHTIKSFPLNFENVWDAESAAFRDCFKSNKTQNNQI